MRGFGTPPRTHPSQGGLQHRLWGRQCHRSPSRGRAAALGSHRAAAGSSSPTSQEHTHTPKKNPPTANRERNPGFPRPLTNPQRFLKESPCSLQSPGPAPAPLIPFCLLKSPSPLKFGWAGAAERCSVHGDALGAGCRTCASRMPGAFWDSRCQNCTETSPLCFLRPNPCFSLLCSPFLVHAGGENPPGKERQDPSWGGGCSFCLPPLNLCHQPVRDDFHKAHGAAVGSEEPKSRPDPCQRPNRRRQAGSAAARR